MEKLFDVLDENGIKTGQTLPRSEVHKNGLWHRAILVAIVDGQNKILLHQRSGVKDKNPNMWDISVVGHISAGQDSLTAACIETKQRLGYEVDESQFRYMFSFRSKQQVSENFCDRQYYDFFVLKKEKVDTKNINFDESGISEVKLVSKQELLKMIEQKMVVERNEVYKVLLEYLA